MFTSQLGTVNSQLGQMVLGQDYSDPFTQTVESTLVWDQDVSLDNYKIVSADSTLVWAQDVDIGKVFSRLIVSGFPWSQTVARNVDYVRSVSNTIVPTQSIVGSRVRTVASTLVWSQDIDFENYKHIQHTMEFQQSVELLKVSTRSVLSLHTPYQTISRNVELHPSVTSTLTWSQNVIGDAVRGVQQVLTWSQSIDAYAAKAVKNVLSFSQTIGLLKVVNPIVNSALTWNQTIGLQRSRAVSVSHAIPWQQFVRKYRVVNETVSQTLIYEQLIRFRTYVESVDQTLTWAQDIDYTPVRNLAVVSTLSFGQTIGRSLVYAREVAHQIVYPQTRSVYVGLGGTENIILDNIQYALVRSDTVDIEPNISIGPDGNVFYTRKRRPFPRKYCVLSAPNAAVVLPPPEFGNSENNTSDFVLKKSMNNVNYTYVRNLNLKVLKWQFVVTKSKSWELREFLIRNSGENSNKLIDLYTWEGDKWKVFVKSNPVELIVTGKYSPTNEKVSINLEFEGIKVM